MKKYICMRDHSDRQPCNKTDCSTPSLSKQDGYVFEDLLKMVHVYNSVHVEPTIYIHTFRQRIL
jgi:hypothetical protein